jgi:hypothetical protein
MKKIKARLNKSFPRKIEVGCAINERIRVVPLSSSETNVRESPDIAEKKTTTQSIPAKIFVGAFSLPMENRIILIATIMNIIRAFSA